MKKMDKILKQKLLWTVQMNQLKYKIFRGGMYMEQKIDLNFALNQIASYSHVEEDIASTFVEMLKDEINSVEEDEIYHNVKNLIIKYRIDEKALNIIDEVITSITGGATMTEILLVARDEIVEPTSEH